MSFVFYVFLLFIDEIRLGMKYADESQVIYFNDSENSYVRQYQDVPDAK